MKWKFEYTFAFAILAVLSVSLYVFRHDTEATYLILSTLIGGFSAITTYFFTNKDNDKPDK